MRGAIAPVTTDEADLLDEVEHAATSSLAATGAPVEVNGSNGRCYVLRASTSEIEEARSKRERS